MRMREAKSIDFYRDTRWWVSFGKLSNGDGRS